MRLTYLFDPLCGWCYGAGPALEQLSQLDNVAVELAPIGLFAGEGARPMDASFAAYAWQNDQRIARFTGQPFTAAYRHQVLAAAAPCSTRPLPRWDWSPWASRRPTRSCVRSRSCSAPAMWTVETPRSCRSSRTSSSRPNSPKPRARVRSPDEDLLAAYRQRLGTARADMRQFGAEGVPALLIGEDAERRLLRADALFAGFAQLTAQLQAA